MKLIATALALACTLLLTGCTNRDAQDANRNDQTVVTEDTGRGEDRTEMPDPAGDAEYEADRNGSIESDTLPNQNDTNTGNNHQNNAEADHNNNNGSVMEDMKDAAEDVGDAARDMADNVMDGTRRAVNDVENSMDRNR